MPQSLDSTKKKEERKDGPKEHEAPNRADQMQLECREENAELANDAEEKPGHERESLEKRQWHGISY